MTAPCAKRSLLRWITLVSLALGAPVSAAPSQTPNRLPREDLLLYHARHGEVMRAKTKAGWLKRREEVLAGMQQVMGPLPGIDRRCALDMRIETETDCGAYLQRLITYASEPGSRVPAYCLIPKAALQGTKRFPAVLALHSTDMEFGHRVLVEPVRTHYRAFARDLVERQFVVLAPAYPQMANYHPDLDSLGYRSGSMKAIWDNLRGVDLLESLPFVIPGRIGALGHSLGGHNAIYTAVFDQRIRAIVSSCGFDSFLDYKQGNIEGWTSPRYMPRLRDYQHRLADIPFDFHELIGALAPRPVFINAPIHDSNFAYRSVDRIVTAAKPVYRLYGATRRLVALHPDCGHDFPADTREQAYSFLADQLK
ncbi:MAG TPA: alpha/beta hydrolase [Clostridia bacterium]|nr:alpha/beta hydrolase [Clostridia bacterium]